MAASLPSEVSVEPTDIKNWTFDQENYSVMHSFLRLLLKPSRASPLTCFGRERSFLPKTPCSGSRSSTSDGV